MKDTGNTSNEFGIVSYRESGEDSSTDYAHYGDSYESHTVNDMNIQPSTNDSQFKIEQRIRTIRTLWIAMFLSVCIYYVFTLFVGQRSANHNNTLSLVLLAVGLSGTLLSFPIKKRLLTQSVNQQRVQLVQQGYIVAWAVTEVAALLGLLDFFATGNRYYYFLFIISACGQLLHFPKRQHVLDASFKNPTL